MKICSTCKTDKPLSEFYKNKCGKDGLHGECKPCNRARASLWAKNNKHRVRFNRVKKAYGISSEQYLKLIIEQNNCCDICKKPLDNGKHTCVDHNHSTGAVRGILCNNCNFILGHAKDNSDILKSAQEYLQKYNSESQEK